MLTVTPQASEAIRGILESPNVPDDAVVRISPPTEAGTQQETGLVVSVTDSPAPDDQVVEGDDVEVHVEPSAAQILDDKELDATVAGDQVSFIIGHQDG